MLVGILLCKWTGYGLRKDTIKIGNVNGKNKKKLDCMLRPVREKALMCILYVVSGPEKRATLLGF